MSKTRILNDRLRNFQIGGELVLTQHVALMSQDSRSLLLNKLQTFDSFNEGNDPYGEHDFGCIEMEGERFFFKIDYYDPTYNYRSEDPSDEHKTCRVLTLMHSSEY